MKVGDIYTEPQNGGIVYEIVEIPNTRTIKYKVLRDDREGFNIKLRNGISYSREYQDKLIQEGLAVKAYYYIIDREFQTWLEL